MITEILICALRYGILVKPGLLSPPQWCRYSHLWNVVLQFYPSRLASSSYSSFNQVLSGINEYSSHCKSDSNSSIRITKSNLDNINKSTVDSPLRDVLGLSLVDCSMFGWKPSITHYRPFSDHRTPINRPHVMSIS